MMPSRVPTPIIMILVSMPAGFGVGPAPYAEPGIGRLNRAEQMRADLRADAVGSDQHVAREARCRPTVRSSRPCSIRIRRSM